MARSTRPISGLASTLVLACLIIGAASKPQADELPPLWGYGVKSCNEFLSAAEGNRSGSGSMPTDYDRYEDWLTGFISGLNLAMLFKAYSYAELPLTELTQKVLQGGQEGIILCNHDICQLN